MSEVRQARGIVLCADDFGANVPACNAIIELARAHAISATSCLVYGPCAASHAARLQSSAPDLSIGLHLDLTEFAAPPIRTTLNRWLLLGFVLRNIDRSTVRAEIQRQLRHFEDLFSSAPAFVDGHRHVHQIPGVREPLLQEMTDRYGTAVAIRSTWSSEHLGVKSRCIQELGGRTMRDLIVRASMRFNPDFAGAYDFSTDRPFQRRMEAWLAHLQDGGLVMCHPEMPSRSDDIRTAREAEFEFLSSADWPALLSARNLRLQAFTGDR